MANRAEVEETALEKAEFDKEPVPEISHQLKLFAIELLKDPRDPLGAATIALDGDEVTAMKVYMEWANDTDVEDYQRKHLSLSSREGQFNEKLPEKEAYAKAVYELANDGKVDYDTRYKYHKLYGDVQGFIQKPETTTNVQINQSQSRVMIVKDHGSDEDWEESLSKQQDQLTIEAKAEDIVVEIEEA